MNDLTRLYNEADALKDDQKFDEAIAKLTEALEIDAGYVLGHHLIARCYSLSGRSEDAIRHAEQAAELEPDAFSFTSLSVIYQRAYQHTGNPQYIHLAEEAKARSHMLG